MISEWGAYSKTYAGFARWFCCSLPYPSELGTVVKQQNPPGSREGFCAEEEIRTPTAVTPLPPQGSASTNFATSAFLIKIICKTIFIKDCKCREFFFIQLKAIDIA